MPYAELYGQSSTVTANAVTVTLPAGEANSELIVIDSILITGQSSGAGALTIEHNIGAVGAVIFFRQQLTATAAPEFFQLDFSGGWPIWTTTGSDALAGGATDIVLRGPATLSNATLTVLYHYEKSSQVRN